MDEDVDEMFLETDNHGMQSKCRFDGAEGTEERVLALQTKLCRVREERETSRPRGRT